MKKRIGILLGGLLFLFLAVLAWLPKLAENFAFNNLPPDERDEMKARYHNWHTVPIKFPAEAIEAKPFSAETQAAAEDFNTRWEDSKDQIKAILNSDTKSNSTRIDLAKPSRDFAALRGALNDATSLTTAFETLVRRPDFRVAAFAVDPQNQTGGVAVPNFLMVQSCARLMILKALSAAHEGKMPEALRAAEAVARAAQVEPYDTLIGQLVAISALSESAAAWAAMVRQCTDPALLRQTLNAQNRLAGEFVFFGDGSVPIEAIDKVGMLRQIKRRGFKVEFQNLTIQQLYAQWMLSQAEVMETLGLPELKNDPVAMQKLRWSIANYRLTADQLGGTPSRPPGIFWHYASSVTAPNMFKLATPNFLEAQTRARTALARFDLLRLETARKLYTIEKGKAPARPEDLVPGYLPKLPVDRFATGNNKQATYPETSAGYYSIGPDTTDNAGKINYDPSNGTLSGGDVSLAK